MEYPTTLKQAIKSNVRGFTEDQEKAIRFIEDFTKSDKRIVTIDGSAGTGKTYITKYICDNVLRMGIILSAPTHKAVRNIERQTARSGKTIHSLLGLRLNADLENFDINNPAFTPIGDPLIRNYKYVIIDEASQINNNLRAFIEHEANTFRTKIIFVGDECQLPPVKESSSSVFKHYPKSTLNEVVRQKINNPLLEILCIIRDDIKNGTSYGVQKLVKLGKSVNEEGHGFIVYKKAKFTEELINHFKSTEFSKNVDYCRLTAWTNKAIKHWNDTIRENTVRSGELISKDDLFMGYRTILDEYNQPNIINSEDYIAKNILNYKSEEIKSYITLLDGINTKSSKNVKIIDHRDSTSLVNYYNKLKYLYLDAMYCNTRSERAGKWKMYFNYKDSNISMVDLTVSSNEGTYLFTAKKDIDYGYGITIHKSQGSTFDNIFVDLNDIYSVKTSNDIRNKLLYVALSRASKMVYVYY